MNPYGDIDLTRYLQTEGRRRAAELARQQTAERQPDSGQREIMPGQQSAGASALPPPPLEQGTRLVRQAGSLTEVLRQMGVSR